MEVREIAALRGRNFLRGAGAAATLGVGIVGVGCVAASGLAVFGTNDAGGDAGEVLGGVWTLPIG